MKWKKQKWLSIVLLVICMSLLASNSSVASVIKIDNLGWAGQDLGTGDSYIIVQEDFGTSSLTKVRVKRVGKFKNVSQTKLGTEFGYIARLNEKQARKLEKKVDRLEKRGKVPALKTRIKVAKRVRAKGKLRAESFNSSSSATSSIPTSATPEPATLLLLGSGIVGLAALRKKAQR